MNACTLNAVIIPGAAVVGGLLVGYILGRASAGGKKKAPRTAPARKPAPAPRRDPRPLSEPVSRPPIPAGSVELYVGNLSYDMDEAALRAEFEKFGAVDSVRVVTNRYNNKSKGFAFVVMPKRAEAEKAIAEMNEREVMGRRMRVNEAQNTNKMDS